MRAPDTWVVDPAQASANELCREIDRLRAEVARLRGELEAERTLRLAPSQRQRRVTASFVAPDFPATERPPPPPLLAHAPTSRRTVADDGPARAGFAVAPLVPSAALPSEQGLDFGAIKQLTPEQLDALPYGLITLDAEGRILRYNDTESRLVGLPPHKVLGRRFFGEVAPCARVREFEGRFLEMVRDPYRVRVQTFDFVFRFANGDQQVTIVLTPAKERGQYHMALLRRG